MDYEKLVKEIDEEIVELTNARNALVKLGVLSAGRSPEAASLGGKSRRGRKSMGSKERGEVSERMKKYWSNRRKRGNA